MAGNATTSGSTTSWANVASKLNSLMPGNAQVNGNPGVTTGGRRRRRKSKKGSRKAGRKSRRHRKRKMLGFEIF
jgi:hypothetical protein